MNQRPISQGIRHAYSERDFPEDAHEENGNYFCTCVACCKQFVGNKRRVICKACHVLNRSAFAAHGAEEKQ